MGGGNWVFGYGSLVSPASLALTIGHLVQPSAVAVAELGGYGRRWNYGAQHVRGAWTHDGVDIVDGVIVALGLVDAADETCNGVAVEVTDDELAGLDRRERDYQRTDVTDRITILDGVDGVAAAQPAGARFVTYVPRASAVDRYAAGRDAGRAAIRADYWDLVDGAFAALGRAHLSRYRTTPAPDVPIVEMQWTTAPPRR